MIEWGKVKGVSGMRAETSHSQNTGRVSIMRIRSDLFSYHFSGTHLDAPAHFSEGKWRVSNDISLL